MPYAIFWGCKTGYYQRRYKDATTQVIRELNLPALELEFNCCGYPVRDLYFDAFILSAARNMALAGAEDLDLLTPCKCCFGNFKFADHYLREDEALKNAVNARLREEGLAWDGRVQVRHLLTVLDRDVGRDALAEKAVRPLDGWKVAVHYGCQALRPGRITGFDDPLNPTIFERLVRVTGAEPVEWSHRLQCCGNPVMDKNPEVSLKQLRTKTESARNAGAESIVAACNCCMIQYDNFQARAAAEGRLEAMPALAYTQLLGLSMGLSPQTLGLEEDALRGPRSVSSAS